MEIVYYPDPVLQRRAVEVDPARPGLGELVQGMIAAMQEASGVGLAAPQVGEGIRLFVANDTGEPEKTLVCLNPRLELLGPVVVYEEGCLSLPGIRADIGRAEGVRMTWQDLAGNERTGEFHDLMARILQHEYDHLEGVLFFERMTPTDRMRVKADLKAFEEQYRTR